MLVKAYDKHYVLLEKMLLVYSSCTRSFGTANRSTSWQILV